MQFTLNGFIARNVTLRQIIQEAYGVYEQDRLSGGPRWLSTERFDVDAKIEGNDVAKFEHISVDQRRSILQKFLAERFKLRVHDETKTIPAYALVISKGGPKLKVSNAVDVYHSEIKGIDGLVTRSEVGLITVKGFTMKQFAKLLYPSAQLIVVDETGLTGRYDFELQWTPYNLRSSATNSSDPSQNAATPLGVSGPSIFTALKEQLGLKLESIKYPISAIVVDQVNQPSPN